MKIVLFLILILASACTSDKAAPSETDVPSSIKGGFKTPESFCYCPSTGDYFISNINGSPDAPDNNGFITRLDKNFKITDLKFISGGTGTNTLHAPKGMAVYKEKLYVTDITKVAAFSIKNGKQAAVCDMTRMGVQFLNDITVMDEKIYVSDTFGQTIYRLDPSLNKAEAVATLKQKPNGLCPAPEKKVVCIATWGNGKILHMDSTGKTTCFFDGSSAGLKDLDGIVCDKQGNLIFSSFTLGRIYRLTPDKTLSTIAEDLVSPADIGIDEKGRLLVPYFKENSAGVLKITPPHPTNQGERA